MQSSCSLVGYLKDGFPVYGLCEEDGRRLRSCYRLVNNTVCRILTRVSRLVAGASGHHTTDYTFQPGPDCQLDKANGYTFSDGSYGYIFTDNYPFIMPGYVGTDITDICSL